jgi:SAM-dependent methyltransferase
MNNNLKGYFNAHEKRVRLTLNLLMKYIDSDVFNAAIIGFSDVDQLFMNTLGNRKITFIVPEEFRPYIKDIGKEYIFADITKEIPSETREKFDLVIFTEVLEHILASDKMVMANIFSLLLPGGTLCFSVPNIATFSNRIRLLMGTNVCWPKEDQVKGVFGGHGHIREYTIKEAIDLMRDFQIITIKGISGYRSGLKRLLNLLPAGYQNTIVVIGRRL